MLLKITLWAMLIGSLIMGYFGIQSGSATNTVIGIGVLIAVGFLLYFLIQAAIKLGFVFVKLIIFVGLMAALCIFTVKGCQFLFNKGKELSVTVSEKTDELTQEAKEITKEAKDKIADQSLWDKIKGYIFDNSIFTSSKDSITKIASTEDDTVSDSTSLSGTDPLSNEIANPPPKNLHFRGVVSEVRTGYLLRIGSHFIKLYGIDAPDIRQNCLDGRGNTYECGRKSKQMLERLVLGKVISCQAVSPSYNGNYIATCMIQNFDVGASMVSVGWALADRMSSQVYIPYETKAHQKKEGLWEGKFVAPWEARKMQMPQREKAQNSNKKGFLGLFFK